MRYSVDVAGQTVQVDVRQGPAGAEVSVAGGPWRPARLTPAPAPLYTLELGDERLRLVLAPERAEPGSYRVAVRGGSPLRVTPVDARALAAAKARGASRARGPRTARAAMPGVIVEVRVAPGDHVTQGQVLLILEAMKMQNEIASPADGVVKAVHVAPGASVAGGDPLVEFEPPPAAESS